MPAAKTIACPECSAPLRVRSLKSVSDTDTCPDCGTLLKTAAQEQASEPEPVHPALVEAEARRRLTPARIAAGVTGVLAVAIVAPLLWSSPDPNPVTETSSGDPALEAAVAASLQPEQERPTEPNAIDEQTVASVEPNRVATDAVTSKPGDEGPVAATPETETPAIPEEQPGPESEKPETSTVPVVTVVDAAPDPAATTTGTAEKPEGNPDGNPVTPSVPSRPKPKPPSLDERLSVSIAKFELKSPVPLWSVLETVEIMAGVQIEVSTTIPQATFEREIAVSLKDTTPRGILDEAAKRSGLSVSLSGDAVQLVPATE